MNHDTVTVAQLFDFEEVIDVRSPSEFTLDHVPGAINCPVLDDAERARIGTLYVQDSPFAAKRAGGALIARNIARHMEERFAGKAKSWRPLIYCWRGGQRSAAMAHVLRQVGWDAKRLAGGYKAYRRGVVAGIPEQVAKADLRVICGSTGSGKSLLLRHLEQAGAQVLDLEAMAAHRGSLLGELPGEPQPSQKMFESRLWLRLRALDPGRPVFIESESRKVGNLQVPESLIARMWDSPCIVVQTPTPLRVQLLLRDYLHFTGNAVALCEKLDRLAPLHGLEKVQRWKQSIAAGRWEDFVAQILESHYDPAYARSIAGHYPKLDNALQVSLTSADDAALGRAARELLAAADAPGTCGPSENRTPSKPNSPPVDPAPVSG